jgi:AcrR family transcriptional regulator
MPTPSPQHRAKRPAQPDASAARADAAAAALRAAAPPGSAAPLAGARPERADAARNRVRILDAARALFAERGVAEVTLEEVARAAGVGKATLFRRFGDRAALFLALLDEHERELQDDVLRGAPPIGPGAPARERLLAFLDALLALSLEHRELLLASETARPGARLQTGAYAFWHRHVSWLLTELGAKGDCDLLAHLLLAAFDAELLTALRDQGRDERSVGEAIRALAEGIA